MPNHTDFEGVPRNQETKALNNDYEESLIGSQTGADADGVTTQAENSRFKSLHKLVKTTPDCECAYLLTNLKMEDDQIRVCR